MYGLCREMCSITLKTKLNSVTTEKLKSKGGHGKYGRRDVHRGDLKFHFLKNDTTELQSIMLIKSR